MADLVFKLIDEEKKRQKEGLELIPSENYVSKAVLEAMGSVLTNKYSEGYPSFEGLSEPAKYGTPQLSPVESSEFTKRKTSSLSSIENPESAWSEREIAQEILPNYRYYGGQDNIDRIERLAIARACKLFKADHANVQPHSGANANEAVYFAWCEPGDKILAMNLAHGGHLTHGAPVTRSAKIYRFVSYGVDQNGDIDYDELERVALEELPRLILVGYSAFMKIPDFQCVADIRKKVEEKTGGEVLLMADMAHVAGLIAGGEHPNPFDFGFDVITTTTHKTLRGPRGGLILSKGKVSSPLKKPEKTLENLPTLIDRAVFPGTQGGPLEHVIAAKAVAFGEALKPDFKRYAKQIVTNAKALAEELKRRGFILQGDGTENHLILVNVEKSFGLNGKDYEKVLDLVGLTLNANALPGDKQAAFRPSGVRLGTPAMTTRGLEEPEMKKVAEWMEHVARICAEASGADKADNKKGCNSDDKTRNPDGINFTPAQQKKLAEIREEVKRLALKFPLPNEE